jgi:hypothetical protein
VPKIRRANLPKALFEHLLNRVEQREISVQQLVLLSDWLATEPEVPTSTWFKRFPEMTVCGEGELVKTFLRLGQIAEGQEVADAH